MYGHTVRFCWLFPGSTHCRLPEMASRCFQAGLPIDVESPSLSRIPGQATYPLPAAGKLCFLIASPGLINKSGANEEITCVINPMGPANVYNARLKDDVLENPLMATSRPFYFGSIHGGARSEGTCERKDGGKKPAPDEMYTEALLAMERRFDGQLKELKGSMAGSNFPGLANLIQAGQAGVQAQDAAAHANTGPELHQNDDANAHDGSHTYTGAVWSLAGDTNG